MIYICDSIMGSGKSSAAISFMNDHPEQKFIYITPYKSESKRIQDGCPHLNFVRPSNRIPEYNFRKTEHIAALIKEGSNITTTHQAFREFKNEMKQDIAELGYILIIDEDVSMLEAIQIDEEDMKMALDADRIKEDDNGFFTKGDKPYKGKTHKRMISVLDSRKMVNIISEDGTEMYYWMLPPDLIECFKDVYVLTYMFEAQSLRYMFDMNKMVYSYIYIRKVEDRYEFTSEAGWMPEYVLHLRDKIHILDNKKLNNIGNRETSLSISWMQNNHESVAKLRKDIYNYFQNYCKTTADDRMWGTYKGSQQKLKGNGYSKAFVAFNTRAVNDYADRHVLAYAVNIYMNVGQKLFYQRCGVKIDRATEDMYALSTMIQWIWRSAIRNGEDINIYIPSKRMRTLLVNWMDELAKGGAN